MKKTHHLLVQTPTHTTQTLTYPITDKPLIISTSDAADVQLRGPGLDGLQASISPTPIGALLQNKGSDWRILVNGMAYDEFYLTHFDTLSLTDKAQTFLLARYLERPIREAEETITAPHWSDPPSEAPRDIDPLSTFFLPRPFYALLGALRGPASLLLVNIDKLKHFNDFYGFPGGDALLRMVSLVIRTCTPAPNLIGRVSGDRFVVLLPSGDLQMAAYLAEELRALVEQSSVYQARATIRAIVATLPPGALSKDEIEALSATLDQKNKNTVSVA